jgi:hypothetical protein
MLDCVEELRAIWEFIASTFHSQFTTFFILFLIVVVALWLLVFKSNIKDICKNHQEGLCMLFLGVLIGGTLFYGVFMFGLVDSDAGKTEIVQKNSLHVAYNDDFEDIKDSPYDGPWVACPTEKNHGLAPSDKYAHSGNHSLKLTVNNQPHKEAPAEEYGGIGITDLNIHKAKTIEAWVLVPKSDQARGSTIISHIFTYIKDSSGKNIGIYSKDEKLKPGFWTQIFLGVCYTTDCKNCTFEWDGTIDQLYLTVWSDQSYWGSIYIDNITIWK